MGTRGVVSSGHYLATAAGSRIMQMGGNAVDAAAAMSFCLNLVEPHQNGIGGEVPVLFYSADERKTYTISGQGWSPEALTIDWCRENRIDMIPGDGFIPACVPATVGTWALALKRFGTMSFSEILAPAIELASNGFSVYPALRDFIMLHAERFRKIYPSTAECCVPGGKIPQVGEVLRNPHYADVLKTLCEAEENAPKNGRDAGIDAACDAFYKGNIAKKIIEYITENPVEDASGREHRGLLIRDDFAEWEARIEEPVSINYKGLDVHKCSSWTQGPVFLQQLALLKGFDGESSDYLHVRIECAKLAFADREAYYGDPLFDDVPLDTLLSEEYSAERRKLIGENASMELRPGDMDDGAPEYATFDVLEDNRRALGISSESESGGVAGEPRDTTQLVAIDSDGNMVSATPSGGWLHSSPIIPGLGFPLGTRAQMFYLNPDRPNALEPRKRPRTTLTPTLVTRDGRPYLAFGTPGGDAQDQWTLQFFLNYVEPGMDLATALDSPHWKIEHMPLSFYPRTAYPGRVTVDRRFSAEIISELKERGHEVVQAEMPIRMMAALIDGDKGSMSAGVCTSSATGYAIAL